MTGILGRMTAGRMGFTGLTGSSNWVASSRFCTTWWCTKKIDRINTSAMTDPLMIRLTVKALFRPSGSGSRPNVACWRSPRSRVLGVRGGNPESDREGYSRVAELVIQLVPRNVSAASFSRRTGTSVVLPACGGRYGSSQSLFPNRPASNRNLFSRGMNYPVRQERIEHRIQATIRAVIF